MKANLWMDAFYIDNKIMNEAPIFHNPYKKSPQVLFLGYQVDPNSKHEIFRMSSICSRQRTPIQANKQQLVREIKGGSILSKVIDKI